MPWSVKAALTSAHRLRQLPVYFMAQALLGQDPRLGPANEASTGWEFLPLTCGGEPPPTSSKLLAAFTVQTPQELHTPAMTGLAVEGNDGVGLDARLLVSTNACQKLVKSTSAGTCAWPSGGTA